MSDPIFVQPKAGTGAVFLHNTSNTDASSKVGAFKEGQRLQLDQQSGDIVACKVFVAAENVSVSADNKSISLPPGNSVNLRSSNDKTSAANIISIWSGNLSLELIGSLDTWQIARVYVDASVVDVLMPGQQPTLTFGAMFNPADFVNLSSAPNSQRTPPATGTFQMAVASKIWNMYGGLIDALSQKINIDPAMAVAVVATESNGQASGAAGRMTIRFENQLFWSRWGKDHADVYNQLFQFDPQITWQGHKFRPDSTSPWLDVHASQDSEYAALAVARNLDDTIALSCISMGLVQILGSNFAACGYPSIQAMFDSFSADPRNQLIGFFNFVVNDPAKVTAMQQKDYPTFARRYNGSGQIDFYAARISGYVDAFNSLLVQPGTPPAPSTLKGMLNTLTKGA